MTTKEGLCHNHHPNDVGSNLRGADVLFSLKSKNLMAWKWDVVHHLFNIGAWDPSRDRETGQVSPFSYNPVCSLCVCVRACHHGSWQPALARRSDHTVAVVLVLCGDAIQGTLRKRKQTDECGIKLSFKLTRTAFIPPGQ